jgi:hypothetical protein
MFDVETFITWLYTVVDDYCQRCVPDLARSGPRASLTCSEVVTLAVFGQWRQFESERAFFRHACRHLRPFFPQLPDRSQFNRLLRCYQDAIVSFGLYLAHDLADPPPFEALDSTAVPTRHAHRRGHGWLAGEANIGWSTNHGWFEGVRLLAAVSPDGVITGFGLGPANVNDRAWADTFLAVRQAPDPHLSSPGDKAVGPYLVDKGFHGRQHERHWQVDYGATVIAPPEEGQHLVWSAALKRQMASLRQIVETAFNKLLYTFGLRDERPHDLSGLRARVAAKTALFNFCIWLNRQCGRPNLAFAELIAW